MPQAVITLNNSDVIRALKEANAAMEAYEKGGEQAAEKLSSAFTRMQSTLVTVTDKHRTSLEKLTQAAERQAEVYGKTPIERLVSQRDALIKRLGDEKEMVDRVTASYSKMIEAQQRQGEGGFNVRYGIFAAKDIMEGRVRNAAAEFINLTSAMSGTAAIAGGVALGIAAIGGAALESYKSLAAYGTELGDIEAKTGMTGKQIEAMRYAFASHGKDLSDLDRLTRGLATALDDYTAQGDKARKALTELGVSTSDYNGRARPMQDVLLDLSGSLARIQDPLKADALAQDLFKRGAIELIPVLRDLKDRYDEAIRKGLGPDEASIRAWEDYQKHIADTELRWRDMTTHVKSFLAELVDWTAGLIHGIGNISDQIEKVVQDLQNRGLLVRAAPAPITPAITPLPGPGIGAVAPGIAQQLAESTIRGEIAQRRLQQELGTGGLEQMEQRRKALQQDYDEAYSTAKKIASENGKTSEAYEEQLKKVRDTRMELEKQVTAIEGIREAQKWLKKESLELVPFTMQGMAVPGYVSPYAAAAGGRTGPVPSLFGGTLEISPEDIARANAGVTKAQQEAMSERWKATIDQWKQQDKDREQTAKALLDYQIEMIKLQSGPGSELDTAEKVAAIKMQMAKDDRERFAISLDLMKQEAEIQKKADEDHAREVEKQQREIAKAAEPLFHTLLTQPHRFPQELTRTLREAAVRPISEGLGNLTGQLLQPILFGNRGGLQDVKLVGGAVPVHVVGASVGGGGIVNIPLGPMGGAVAIPSIGAGGGALPGGGVGAAPGGAPISLPSLFGGANPASIIGPGGTPGFAPGPLGIGGHTGGFGGLFGGGFGGIGTNLGRIFGIGQTPVVTGTATNLGIGSTTTLGGVLSSPAAGLGGMMLAQQSLLGPGAGTGWGIAGGAAGGALLGMQFGGPIGGAIGAGVGAAIGLGELLAGVEPQWKEAERLVKQHYHINIDHAEGQRIADIANQSFGGKVSLAVMSPQVRQMLGVYALGTGQQNTALSSMIPHAGSLVEQGGRMYQAATYSMGQGGLYQSSLPTLAGNPGAVTWPTAGAGQTISLNINGQSAADLLSGRVTDIVNPGYVSSIYEQSQYESDGRVANYANSAQPGLIIS